MQQMQDKKRRVDFFKLVSWGIVIIAAVNVFGNFGNSSKKRLDIQDGNWSKLALILQQIDQNYVDTVNTKEFTEKILPNIMLSLDPHSSYLPPVELEEADASLEGNFGGIGVQFNVPNDTATIISVISGGPSEKVGILSGDKIINVDGKKVAGVKINQDSLVKSLKGEEGTIVKVDIKRDDVEGLMSFTIERGKIPVKSIDVAMMLNDSVAYVKLSKFNRTSYMEFQKSVIPLKEKGMKHLVFDLRENAGGYLDQALLLSNEFLSKDDLIVYMEGAHRKRQDFHADGTGKLIDVGLYVLINESSASSSEVFAGAIQDNDRGIIVGRRSYGKGLVQEPIYFTDKSGIRLTVARFYTPTGRCIQKPYSEDYEYDIYERYRHGEMVAADSIRVNDSLKYTTPKGKIVYGGGGITPDEFVPIDTVGVTDFLIKCNRKSLLIKYSNELARQLRGQLRGVKSFEQYDKLIGGVDLKGGFLGYAKANGIVPKKGEWEISQKVIIMQLKALVGRYTVLDDMAFYPYIIQIDNVMDKVNQIIK